MPKDKSKKGIKSTAKKVISRGEKALFAGMGALAKVEEEGRDLLGSESARLMDQLVGEGRKIVSRGSKSAKLDKIQNAVSDSFDKARRQVADAYDKVTDQADALLDDSEQEVADEVFGDRVAAVLTQLDYPTRADFVELLKRVDQLSAQLDKRNKAQ